MGVEVAIRNYEDALIGRRKFSLKIPSYLDRKSVLEKGTAEDFERIRDIQASKENDALAVVRYAVTGILGWTPQEAFESFNGEIIKKLQLELACKHISFPRDLSPSSDYWWIIYKAFPAQVSFDPYQRILNMYKKVLNGEIKYFPKKVFDGAEGFDYLNSILHYYITENIPADSIEDLYDYFGDKPKMIKELKQAKLFYAYKNRFYAPLDWLHSSLGEDANNFYYRNQQYMQAFAKKELEMKRKKYAEAKRAKA